MSYGYQVQFPTQTIKGNERSGNIYRRGRQIGIDCGACFSTGRVAALCLETGEEFYVERKNDCSISEKMLLTVKGAEEIRPQLPLFS